MTNKRVVVLISGIAIFAAGCISMIFVARTNPTSQHLRNINSVCSFLSDKIQANAPIKTSDLESNIVEMLGKMPFKRYKVLKPGVQVSLKPDISIGPARINGNEYIVIICRSCNCFDLVDNSPLRGTVRDNNSAVSTVRRSGVPTFPVEIIVDVSVH